MKMTNTITATLAPVDASSTISVVVTLASVVVADPSSVSSASVAVAVGSVVLVDSLSSSPAVLIRIVGEALDMIWLLVKDAHCQQSTVTKILFWSCINTIRFFFPIIGSGDVGIRSSS